MGPYFTILNNHWGSIARIVETCSLVVEDSFLPQVGCFVGIVWPKRSSRVCKFCQNCLFCWIRWDKAMFSPWFHWKLSMISRLADDVFANGSRSALVFEKTSVDLLLWFHWPKFGLLTWYGRPREVELKTVKKIINHRGNWAYWLTNLLGLGLVAF